jgi:hypothetical protein
VRLTVCPRCRLVIQTVKCFVGNADCVKCFVDNADCVKCFVDNADCEVFCW